jgi:hypothetical protein
MKKLIYLSIGLVALFVSTINAQTKKHVNHQVARMTKLYSDVDAYNFHFPIPHTKAGPDELIIFTLSDDEGNTGEFKSTLRMVRQLNADCSKVERPNTTTLRVFIQGVIRNGGIGVVTDYQIRHTDLNELIGRVYGAPATVVDTTK